MHPRRANTRSTGAPSGSSARGERARIRNLEVGFIFQTFNLIGDLTVWENVELPLLYRKLSTAERRERVNSALERVKMSHRKNHLPSQLSGGQQQRVSVARAVAGDPAIVLADEPTGSLDSRNGDAVMDLLGELHAGGATICMVTHSHEYARRATRAIHLFDGRVVEDIAHGRGLTYAPSQDPPCTSSSPTYASRFVCFAAAPASSPPSWRC